MLCSVHALIWKTKLFWLQVPLSSFHGKKTGLCLHQIQSGRPSHGPPSRPKWVTFSSKKTRMVASHTLHFQPVTNAEWTNGNMSTPHPQNAAASNQDCIWLANTSCPFKPEFHACTNVLLMQKLKIDFQVFLQPNITLMNLVTESSKYDGRTECILNYRQNTFQKIK